MPSTNLTDTIGAEQLRKVLEEASWRANLSLILLDARGQAVLQSHPMIGACSKVGSRQAGRRDCPVSHEGVIQELAGKQGPRSFPCPAHTGYTVLAKVIAPRSFLCGALLACVSPREDSSWREELFFLTVARLQEQAEIAQDIESLSQEIAHAYEELSLLYEFSGELTAVFDAPTTCWLLLDKAMGVIEAKRGAVLLMDDDGVSLQPVAVKGFSTEEAGQLRLKLGEGIVGRVVAAGEGELLEEVATVPQEERMQDPAVGPIRPPVICCPLKVREQVLGAVAVTDKVFGKRFSAGDLKLLNALASQAAVAIMNARLHGDFRELLVSIIRTLVSAIDGQDPETRGHSERVARLAVAIAREMNLPRDEVDNIEFAALLHDIGMVGLPPSILSKRDRPSPREWSLIMQHPARGAEMVMHIKQMEKILPGILHHHERYDGQGYPRGLSGNDIPLAARIIALADAFDAMTSHRPYRLRSKWTMEEALAELEATSGSQHDPAVFRAFVRAWRHGRLDRRALGWSLRDGAQT